MHLAPATEGTQTRIGACLRRMGIPAPSRRGFDTTVTLPPYSNRVCIVGKGADALFVKMFDPAEAANARAEHDHLLRLNGSGHCPRVLGLDETCEELPFVVLVTSFVDGRVLKDLLPSVGKLRAALDLFLGNVGPPPPKGMRAAKMNPSHPCATADLLATQAATTEPRVKTKGLLNQVMQSIEAVDDDARRQSWAETPLRLCHGDPGLNNAILTPEGRIVIVDWEDVGAGDPACELAKACLHRANAEQSAAIQATSDAMIRDDPSCDDMRRRFEFYLRAVPLFLALRRVAEAHRCQDRGDSAGAASNIGRGLALLTDHARGGMASALP